MTSTHLLIHMFLIGPDTTHLCAIYFLFFFPASFLAVNYEVQGNSIDLTLPASYIL